MRLSENTDKSRRVELAEPERQNKCPENHGEILWPSIDCRLIHFFETINDRAKYTMFVKRSLIGQYIFDYQVVGSSPVGLHTPVLRKS